MIAMCVLYLMEKSRSGEVAIGGRGCHREIVSTRRGRDQEIAPTGEVSGGGRDQEIAPTGEVSGGGRDQEIAPTQLKKNKAMEFPPPLCRLVQNRLIPETSLLITGRFQFAPSPCCFTSGTDVPFETVRTCQGLAISV